MDCNCTQTILRVFIIHQFNESLHFQSTAARRQLVLSGAGVHAPDCAAGVWPPLIIASQPPSVQ